MRKIQIFSICMFITILAVPIVTMNTKKEQVSEIDNRNLTEFPQINLEGGVREQFEAYVNDRIGFRNEMIRFYTVANDKLFHKMVHPSYTYGKDGYVFMHMPFEQLNKNHLDTYAEFVKKMQQDCEKQGIVFEYWLNPSKITVYNEYLPEGANVKDENTQYLLKKLEENNVEYWYSKELLRNAKKDIQVYNKKYDAGHWNDNGGFLAAQEIQQKLIDRGVAIEKIKKEDYEISQLKFDTLPVSYFPISDTTDIYNPKNQTARQTDTYDNQVELDPQFSEFSHYENPKKQKSPKLLMFRGSYMVWREKFFIDQFSESTFIHSYNNVENYQYYIDIFKPDIVIFECAEYVLNETYYPSELLNKALEGKNNE